RSVVGAAKPAKGGQVLPARGPLSRRPLGLERRRARCAGGMRTTSIAAGRVARYRRGARVVRALARRRAEAHRPPRRAAGARAGWTAWALVGCARSDASTTVRRDLGVRPSGVVGATL